jgi:hypothetical protein
MILLWLVAALLAFATGCKSDYQWRAAAASMRVEYGTGTGEIDKSKRDWDTQGTWLAFSIQPLAYLDMEMRAERNALAVTEAMYAARPEPSPTNSPAAICPHGLGSR